MTQIVVVAVGNHVVLHINAICVVPTCILFVEEGLVRRDMGKQYDVSIVIMKIVDSSE